MLFAFFACTSPEPRPLADVERAMYRNVCEGPDVVEGIDVSYWQGTIDWDAVAGDGVEFAIMRVSHGLGTYDTQFTRNWSESKRVGVRRGVYQYFDGNDDPTEQARMLLDEMGPLEDGDLPPTLDVEQGDNEDVSTDQMVANIQTWMDVVESELGVVPMIYAGAYGWTYLTDDADYSRHPLWTANWVDSCPLVPEPWSEWTFWQYSATGSVAGINADVDRDRFDGDDAALEAFAWHPTEACSGSCAIAAEGESVVEEDDACACPEGQMSAIDGHGGHAYTTPVDDGGDDALTWPLSFERAGTYDVWVWVPTLEGPTAGAVYTVAHEGGVDTVTVDQAAAHEWSLLGSFTFGASGSQEVRVSDLADDDDNLGTTVGIDALRLVPIATDCECEDGEAQDQACSDDGVRTRDCEACVWTDWSECRGAAQIVEPEGCACGSAGAGGAAWGVVAAGVLGASRRRRSDRRP